ncbi:MAG: hydrogenase formation protein HypD [Bacillota bacterium]
MNNIQSLYNDKALVNNIVNAIKEYEDKTIKIMEVCGTHTMAISRFGIRSILSEKIRLISGPGCPVCVTPSSYVRASIELARNEGVIVTTFGDMMRIPYKGNSLLREKALGRDIRMVYSPLDSIKVAKENPDKKVVFLSVGFETTIPVIALSVLEALQNGVSNFMLLTANKTIPQAMRVLSSDRDIEVDGFIYPGHVSAIIGTGLYHELALKYGIPGVVAGFDPVDVLGAIYKIIENIKNKEIKVENLYSRIVNPEGNRTAVKTINDVFEECDAVWRGIGVIPKSGLKLKKAFSEIDAWKLLDIEENEQDEEPDGCKCGDILKGKCLPYECKLFGRACTPENPVGSCMVSGEGTCAAYFRYG